MKNYWKMTTVQLEEEAARYHISEYVTSDGIVLYVRGPHRCLLRQRLIARAELGHFDRGKVRKEFWLNPSLLRRAQKELVPPANVRRSRWRLAW